MFSFFSIRHEELPKMESRPGNIHMSAPFTPSALSTKTSSLVSLPMKLLPLSVSSFKQGEKHIDHQQLASKKFQRQSLSCGSEHSIAKEDCCAVQEVVRKKQGSVHSVPVKVVSLDFR
jgi:hypothetical protein